MLITEEAFKTFLECETKSYLRSIVLDNSASEAKEWQRHLAEDFKQKCFAHFYSGSPDECLMGALPEKGAENKYRFVLNCHVQAQGLQSCIHALERLGPPDKTTSPPYIPIRFIPTEKLTISNKLLLAFDSLVIFMAWGKMPPFGKIIHGSELKIT